MPDRSLCLLLFTLILFCNGTNGSFYTNMDQIAVLDHTNFQDTIYGKEHAWLIELYNSWCGHCKQFAPTYKMLASDVRNWKGTVKVSAIDCAEDKSYPICRGFNPTKTPELIVLGARAQQGDIGEKLTLTSSSKSDDIEALIVEKLTNLQSIGNGSSSWVNLQNYESSAEDIFLLAPSSTRSAVIIAEEESSTVGRQVILDLSFIPNVYIRRQVSTSSDPETVVTFIGRNGELTVVSGTENKRDDVTKVIVTTLALDDEYVQKIVDIHTETDEIQASELLKVGAADREAHEQTIDNLPKRATEKEIVYMVDIENALSYAISHEVVSRKRISGDAFESLKRFVEILVKYLPCRPPVKRFLNKFYEYLLPKTEVRGRELSIIVETFSHGESMLPRHQPWIGCKGSDPSFRGFPCGLWTMFHALTVNAVLMDGDEPQNNPKAPLEAILGYIKYFFGCSHCSQHFQKMYAQDAEDFIIVPDDSIVWLWKGHNKVNHRLQDDISEDPMHPKIPYPKPSVCPDCWEGVNHFNELGVITFMKHLYASTNISLKGVQKLLPAPEDSVDRGTNLTGFQQYWRLNYTDASLCMIVYIGATLLLFACYIGFFLKRVYTRKQAFVYHQL